MIILFDTSILVLSSIFKVNIHVSPSQHAGWKIAFGEYLSYTLALYQYNSFPFHLAWSVKHD